MILAWASPFNQVIYSPTLLLWVAIELNGDTIPEFMVRILVQVTIYRRLLIGRDGPGHSSHFPGKVG